MAARAPSGFRHGGDPLGAPQAIIRIVPGGGARTPTQIRDQWLYLSRKGDVRLQRSERHLGAFLEREQLEQAALSWAMETGNYQPDQASGESVQALTTHIIVSFPPGTDQRDAFAAGRLWAEEMFGSGKSGGRFDYLTACHSDRPHPHVHLIVNRRSYEGDWLKISRRHAHLNYHKLRSSIVEVAERFGIRLDASSRTDRGIVERPITYAEYRRQERLAKRHGQAVRHKAAGETSSDASDPGAGDGENEDDGP